MAFTVEPIKPEERPRCLHCSKPLRPRLRDVFLRHPDYNIKGGYLGTLTPGTEQDYKTNHRVVRRIVETTNKHDKWHDVIGKQPLRIRLSIMDEPARWGHDGRGCFCNGQCAESYAYAAAKRLALFQRKH